MPLPAGFGLVSSHLFYIGDSICAKGWMIIELLLNAQQHPLPHVQTPPPPDP